MKYCGGLIFWLGFAFGLVLGRIAFRFSLILCLFGLMLVMLGWVRLGWFGLGFVFVLTFGLGWFRLGYFVWVGCSFGSESGHFRSGSGSASGQVLCQGQVKGWVCFGSIVLDWAGWVRPGWVWLGWVGPCCVGPG
jgi:hypothetical protein